LIDDKCLAAELSIHTFVPNLRRCRKYKVRRKKYV
jgi:hypothetical protein